MLASQQYESLYRGFRFGSHTSHHSGLGYIAYTATDSLGFCTRGQKAKEAQTCTETLAT